MSWCLVLLVGLTAVSAFPRNPVLGKTDPGLRYQYVEDADGNSHLEDLWLTLSDYSQAARYIPDQHNVYHLFTRLNPVVSQPLLQGYNSLLGMTNYNPTRRTIVLLHGWMDTADGFFSNVVVPAFLQAEDVNVIVVDWNAGAGTLQYNTAVINTSASGRSVASFLNWLNAATGSLPAQYHLVGHSLGAHQVGIIGRHVHGNIAYITALDPALPGWLENGDRFHEDDGAFTEVIHTNAGFLGYLLPMGHVDFYPNSGNSMPGCDSWDCDHSRAFLYFSESLTSGGFTGRACASHITAMAGLCVQPGTLRMGGLVPKTGSTGIYHLVTNAESPFSQG